MTSRNEHNRQVIEEFRRSGGAPENRPLLLLHTIGAKSGQPRVNPVMFLQDGDRWVVFASKGGAPNSPDWYHNLRANPDITIEVGSETVDVRATVAEGAERERLFSAQASLYPQFAEYQTKTTRQIPVVVLTRR